MKIPDTLPWRIDPDDRPDMQWNNNIVEVNRPHMTICFMAHDGTEENLEGETNAQYIVTACNMLPELLSALEEIRDAEWQVTHDWGGDRISILNKIDELLKR